MWIIAGLGNPGARFEATPHNLGFDVVRLLAERNNWSWKLSNRVKAEVCEGEIGNTAVRLVMPLTYMNLSGEAVGPLASYYKVPNHQVLAISDDTELPWGRLRLRAKGSHGGHNGLRSLIQHLGNDGFPRVRIGCQPENWRGDLAAYVLAKLRGDALDLSEHMAEIATDAVETILSRGLDKAMTQFNGYDGNGKK